jgi:HlyD family secretion protein
MNALRILLPTLIVFQLVSCNKKADQTDVSGTFEATEVMVSAQASGTLIQLNLEEGQNLKAGQNLGYIDTIQLSLKKKQLRATIMAVKSRIPDVSLQVAALQQQLLTAQNERTRIDNLVKANAAPKKQLDDVNAQIDVLKKQVAANQSTLQNNNLGADNDVESLQAQLEQVDDLLKKSYIQSPMDGTVLEKFAEAGELAVQGKLLFKMANIKQMVLRVYLTADQLAQLKIGQTVKVNAEFGSEQNKTYTGKVAWISAKSEFTPKTVQTRDERANLVYAAKILVPNDGNLKIGMYGGVYLTKAN